MPIAAAALRARRRWERTSPWVVDAALGTAITLAALATTLGQPSPGDGYRRVDAVTVMLVLASSLPYYLRRRAPLPVFAVSATAVALLMLRGNDAGTLPLTLFLGIYTVAARRGTREVVAAAVLVEALCISMVIGTVPQFGFAELVSSGFGFAAAMFAGRAIRSRRQHVALLEREHADAASRAAAEERLRIAQELHDVVAHSLGVIAVQAAVGMKIIDSDVAEARRSLESISRLSRSSLTEIRLLLGAVRSGEGAPVYAPPPGLADVARLARDIADAGLSVDLSVDGNVERIPAGVGLAAYRIVQEALTNSLRHAGAGEARVRLEVGRGMLLIEVIDDGNGPGDGDVRGHGLIGMRERAAVYGGSVETGAGAGGGFRVAARLPYELEPVA